MRAVRSWKIKPISREAIIVRINQVDNQFKVTDPGCTRRFEARREMRENWRNEIAVFLLEPGSPRARRGMAADEDLASDVLRTLHGARGLPPLDAVEALKPFLDAMRKHSRDELAGKSFAAVTELSRSLKENHAASDDLWQDAIEATLSFANEAQ